MRIRHAIRKEFPDLLLFDTLRGTQTNDDSEGVYRPHYAEINSITIHMISHERTRVIKNTKLRTDEGDKQFAPRTRKTAELVEDTRRRRCTIWPITPAPVALAERSHRLLWRR
jgi:hypothetical protein